MATFISKLEQEGQQNGPPRERDRRALCDRHPTARIDEEHLTARRRLDREEVGVAHHAALLEPRERPTELGLERDERAREELVRGAGERAPGASERRPRLGRSDRPDRDLRLRETRDGAHVGR